MHRIIELQSTKAQNGDIEMLDRLHQYPRRMLPLFGTPRAKTHAILNKVATSVQSQVDCGLSAKVDDDARTTRQGALHAVRRPHFGMDEAQRDVLASSDQRPSFLLLQSIVLIFRKGYRTRTILALFILGMM